MALVLEMKRPPSSEMEAAGMLESIWPSIQLAYQTYSAQGVLPEHTTISTNSQKSIVRAGKGTVQRGNTLRLYENG